MFGTCKGYAPLEDRPETHLPLANDLDASYIKKPSSASRPKEEELGFMGGFAKPVSLNPAAIS